MKSLASSFLYLIVVICLSIATSQGWGNKPKGQFDATLKLIIKSYIDELLTNHQANPRLRLKLNQMSDHVANHPALYQKRLYIGSGPPSYEPELLDSNQAMNRNNMILSKRTQLEKEKEVNNINEHFPSEEICPTNRQWEQINKTHDLNDNEVEVIQQEGMTQFIYTYRCSPTIKPESSCTGISQFYKSKCTERFGWVYMFHKKPTDEAPQWGFVATPHHCACKIQPRLDEIVTLSDSETSPAN